ncbi:MAG: hypothetical protein OEV35_02080, partial [Gallionellaceae bacterium]|nr:hypothetical protein [Gallionellaceae bacterium]
MQIDRNMLKIAAALALGITVAGCSDKEPAKPAATAPAAAPGQLPAQHPPLSPELAKDLAQQQEAAKSQQQQMATVARPEAPVQGGKRPKEGKLVIDPTQKFTQFRVGEKNVKSIYNDGKVTWIGTSGGIIRYDASNDTYKVYDASNGLLSNGAFSVGKIKGKIT